MAITGRAAEDIRHGRYDQKEPNHREEDCPNKIKCPNCKENHPAITRFCEIYQREKEILEVKYK